MDEKELTVGTQVAYFPPHVELGNYSHLHVEYGFVTSVKRHWGAFVRYWHWFEKDSNGIGMALRAESYSELTPTDRLLVHKSTDQERVEEELKRLGYL
jgi:hypothetical protein